MKKCFYAAITFAVLLTACGDTKTPGGKSPSAPSLNAKPIAVGKLGNATGINFAVTSVATSSQIGPVGAGPKSEKNETFVIVSYTLKNTSDKPLPLMERPALELEDGTGQAYAQDAMATATAGILMADPSGMSVDLNPNVSAKTKAVWRVSKAAFDRGTWKLLLASDPQLTFALK